VDVPVVQKEISGGTVTGPIPLWDYIKESNNPGRNHVLTIHFRRMFNHSQTKRRFSEKRGGGEIDNGAWKGRGVG